MKLSVSSYSFHQLISAGKMTQLDAIRKAAEMGFDGIEFTDLTPCEKPTKEQQLAYAKELCKHVPPEYIEVEPGHCAACHMLCEE